MHTSGVAKEYIVERSNTHLQSNLPCLIPNRFVLCAYMSVLCKGGGVWESIAFRLTLSGCVGWGWGWGKICMFTGHGQHLSMQTIATTQYIINVLPFMQHEYYRIAQ